ncbi:hypothetical protein [Bradyrhizobium ivorense]|uniref:hypothetical protein n=1 Tax=Bradyrhizobium ivorense TaxID=2511166 RepID=UPI00112035ED|nr:hypothetical protein [Bradyrhizobium ivorense]
MVLLAADWWLPAPAAPLPSAIALSEKVHLRIRSDHKWPERIVFDTAHSEMSAPAELEARQDAIPNQKLAQTNQRNRFDALAAINGNQDTPTATNDKASAIRAKPRPLGARMTSTVEFD